MPIAAQLRELLGIVEPNFNDDLQILSLGIERIEEGSLTGEDIEAMRTALERSTVRVSQLSRLRNEGSDLRAGLDRRPE